MSININKQLAQEIKHRYEVGERNFANYNLHEINLTGLNLSGINFKNSDLSFANLEKADLSGANLSNCNLKCANLKGANLTGAILSESDLSFSKLNGANLHKVHGKNANFQEAHLNYVKAQKAYLMKANFTKSSLNYSDLTAANMSQCELKNAFLTKTNLTSTHLPNSNLMGACLTSAITHKTYFLKSQYSEKTLFSRGFDPTQFGMVFSESNDITIEELLVILNQITKSSKKYLGSSLVVRYWQSSQANNDWLNKFTIDTQGTVSFDGNADQLLNDFQVKWYIQWMKKYFQSCSIIVNNFAILIQEDLVTLPFFHENLKFAA